MRLPETLDNFDINQGCIRAQLDRDLDSGRLRDYEFKIFSQWGEDGIIQRLTEVVEIENETFFEFGVEDFSESNCRFLMMEDDWRGFVIDGSSRNIARLQASNYYWKHDLEARASFITRENIDQLLTESGFDGDLGILSIDLDGIDYHVLSAITSFSPRILICEFNALFGSERKITVPYRPDFDRNKAHFSNLYWGASLGALNDLAEDEGYALVEANSAGNNTFFVRKNLIGERLSILSVEVAFSQPNSRESRNEDGSLSFLRGTARESAINGMPVLNTETGQVEEFYADCGSSVHRDVDSVESRGDRP